MDMSIANTTWITSAHETSNQTALGFNGPSQDFFSSQGANLLPPPPPGGPGAFQSPLFNRPMGFDVVVLFNFTAIYERLFGSAPPIFFSETKQSETSFYSSNKRDFSLLGPTSSKMDFDQLIHPPETQIVYMLRGAKPSEPGENSNRLSRQFFHFGFGVTGGPNGGGTQHAERLMRDSRVLATDASLTLGDDAPAPAPTEASLSTQEPPQEGSRPASEYGFPAGVRTSVTQDDNGNLVVVSRPSSGHYGFLQAEEDTSVSEASREGPAALGRRNSKLRGVAEEEVDQGATEAEVEQRIGTVAQALEALGNAATGETILQSLAEWMSEQGQAQNRLSQMLGSANDATERTGFSASDQLRLYQLAENFGLTHDLITMMRQLALQSAQQNSMEALQTLFNLPDHLKNKGMALPSLQEEHFKGVFRDLIQRLLLGDLMTYFLRSHSQNENVATGDVFKWMYAEFTHLRAELGKIAGEEKGRKLAHLPGEVRAEIDRAIEAKRAEHIQAKLTCVAGKTVSEQKNTEKELSTMDENFEADIQKLREEELPQIIQRKRQEIEAEYAYLNQEQS